MGQAFGSVLKHGTKVDTTSEDDATEHYMAAKIDSEREIKQYHKDLKRLSKGTVDVPGFIKAIAPDLMRQMMVILATTTDKKFKARLIQDLLDRAGYGKIQKGAVLHQGMIDINTSKTELVNLVMSLGKKAGVKVKEESHVEGDEDIIDAITSE